MGSKRLGERILALRERKGLRQIDLAIAADVSPATISTLERGLSDPTLPTLQKLVAVLEVTLDELAGGDA